MQHTLRWYRKVNVPISRHAGLLCGGTRCITNSCNPYLVHRAFEKIAVSNTRRVVCTCTYIILPFPSLGTSWAIHVCVPKKVISKHAIRTIESNLQFLVETSRASKWMSNGSRWDERYLHMYEMLSAACPPFFHVRAQTTNPSPREPAKC